MDGCVYKDELGRCRALSDDECIQYCVEGPCVVQKPSNGDKLRSMTDEDFARFMYRYGGCPPSKPEDCLAKCHKCWERWLKQEAENDGKERRG